MLVLSALLNMAMHDILALTEVSNQGRKEGERPQIGMAREAHNRYRIALNTDPKQYLGDDIPENPAYQQFRAVGKRIVGKVLTGKLPTQQRRTP